MTDRRHIEKVTADNGNSQWMVSGDHADGLFDQAADFVNELNADGLGREAREAVRGLSKAVAQYRRSADDAVGAAHDARGNDYLPEPARAKEVEEARKRGEEGGKNAETLADVSVKRLQATLEAQALPSVDAKQQATAREDFNALIAAADDLQAELIGAVADEPELAAVALSKYGQRRIKAAGGGGSEVAEAIKQYALKAAREGKYGDDAKRAAQALGKLDRATKARITAREAAKIRLGK